MLCELKSNKDRIELIKDDIIENKNPKRKKAATHKGIKGTGYIGYVNAMRFLARNRRNIDPELKNCTFND